jgi:tetratricopeptide (TPR) repeat protein
MNHISRTTESSASVQTTSGGKLSGMQRILKLAINSFSKGKYSLAIDYCRNAVNQIYGREEPAAEAYYIWCLSYLKMNRPREARKVCYDARLKLGNYLDLVYFEILISAINEEMEKIPPFAERFVELYEKAGGVFDPYREKTNIHIGKVLLLAGQAHERLQDKSRADDYFKKYLSLFPEDESIIERLKGKRVEMDSYIPGGNFHAAMENSERTVFKG